MSVTKASLLGDTFGSSASGTIPVGGIIMWSGSTIPTGWSICNGTNGTPDLRDKFIVGAGSGYNVGATGGEASVELTVAQMPSHNHGGVTTGQTANHKHAFPGDDQLSFGNGVGGWSAAAVGYFGYDAASQPSGGQGTMWLTAENNQDHAHGVYSQGGGQTHENRPPYYALAFIMRLS